MDTVVDKNKSTPCIIISVGVLIGMGVGALFISGLVLATNSFSQPKAGMIEEVDSDNAPQINAPAPDFELKSLTGEKKHLADYQGKVIVLNFWATWCGPCIVLNFWATWCGPCKDEMPFFQEIYERYGSEIAVLAVNNQETVDKVSPFVEELGLTYEILMDNDGSVATQYQVIGFPTTYFIDPNGIIKFLHVGVLTEEQLDGYLDLLGVIE
jgi:thiol-disulfide isomerase/thioredoxin